MAQSPPRQRKTGSTNLHPLTDKQAAVLDMIRSHIRRGWPPTRGELAKALDLKGKTSVEVHLMALVRKGYIEMVPNVQRGIRLLIPDEIPLLDIVYTCPAGEPLVTRSRTIGAIPGAIAAAFDPYPSFFMTLGTNAPNLDLLRAGAIVAVHQTPETDQLIDGLDIYVLRIGNEIVCRETHRITSDRLELTDSDGSHRTTQLSVSDVRIEGAVVGMQIGMPISTAIDLRNPEIQT